MPAIPDAPEVAILTSVSPQGLLTYLDTVFGENTEGIELKPYGFTGATLQNAVYDQGRWAFGWRSPTGESVGISPQSRKKSRVFTIATLTPRLNAAAGSFDPTALNWSDYGDKAIREWVNCRSASFRIETAYDFKMGLPIMTAQQSGVPSSNPKANWWVVGWDFTLDFIA